MAQRFFIVPVQSSEPAEAIPVYTVFTNEQLAQIVQQRCRTKADLSRIEGIGEARLEKYAEQVIPLLASLQPSTTSQECSVTP